MGARQDTAEPQGNLLGVLRLNSQPRCPCPAPAPPSSECTSVLSTQEMFFGVKYMQKTNFPSRVLSLGPWFQGLGLEEAEITNPTHPTKRFESSSTYSWKLAGDVQLAMHFRPSQFARCHRQCWKQKSPLLMILKLTHTM